MRVPRSVGPALVLPFLFLVGSCQDQKTGLPQAVRDAADQITAEQLRQDLFYLASDELLGRDTSTPGFDSAAVYIAGRLQEAGLVPLGDDGTFFQHYDLVEKRVDPATADLEVDGRSFRLGEDFALRSLAGPLGGTFPVVYVGHGWTVPGEGIDPYEGMDVRGKLILVHGPEADPPGSTVRRIGRVTPGASSPFVEAERRGAAGVLFIPPGETLAAWDRVRSQSLVRREIDPPVPSAYAALPVTSLLLRPVVLEALLAGEGAGGEGVPLDELLHRQQGADPLPSFELTRSVTVRIPLASRQTSRPYNVIALLEGSDPLLRQEYVTIASHLDGAVGTTPVDGDSIYNSADDNASGSAANLAIAEAMARGPRPGRSLIFIWDSGEERGLWGTRRFVHDPPVPLEAIVAHVNIDMIGANRAPGSPDSASVDVTGPNEVYLVGPGVLSARVDRLLADVNQAYLGMTFNRAYDTPESEFFYPRTDAGPFLERGILTIGFFTGLHDRYHRPADRAELLDPEKMEQITRTIFAGVWALANEAERPEIEGEIPETVPRLGGTP